MAGPLVVERRGERGEVALWTVSRPEAKNALDAATFDALASALAAASADATLRAIVLTGAGDTFVSGGDLRELRTATTDADAERLADLGGALCDAIGRLAVPVIAALPGAAIGGGAELATACDLRVAEERATVCFKHARMGVTTAWGVLPKLVALVGHGAASRLLLTGADLTARDALAVGLVDAVAEDGGGVDLAVAWALEVAKAAPRATASLKALLRETVDASGSLRATERERFVATWTSDDHEEAVEAFFARRPPRWTGR